MIISSRNTLAFNYLKINITKLSYFPNPNHFIRNENLVIHFIIHYLYYFIAFVFFINNLNLIILKFILSTNFILQFLKLHF